MSPEAAVERWEQRLLAARSEQDARPVVEEIRAALPDKGDERRRRLVDLVRRRKAAGWAVVAPLDEPAPPATDPGPPGRLTYEQYAALPGLRWSQLKSMRESPLAFKWARDHENDGEERDHFAFGRTGHTAILEPHRLELDVAVWNGGRRAGGEWKAFALSNAGKSLVRADEYEAVMAMSRSVRAHPVAGPLLAEGRAEVTIQWTDPATGIACKCRVDWIPEELAIVDLKTAASVNYRNFTRDAAKFGYYHQLAFYRRGRAAVLARPLEAISARLLVVEKSPPHDVMVAEIDESTMASADEEVSRLLARLRQCQRDDVWPGAYPQEVLMAAPPWTFSDEEVSETDDTNTNDEVI